MKHFVWLLVITAAAPLSMNAQSSSPNPATSPGMSIPSSPPANSQPRGETRNNLVTGTVQSVNRAAGSFKLQPANPADLTSFDYEQPVSFSVGNAAAAPVAGTGMMPNQSAFPVTGYIQGIDRSGNTVTVFCSDSEALENLKLGQTLAISLGSIS